MELEDVTPNPQIDFPVIGIGASAGGLEAVTTMFHRIKPDLGLAYVLIMHLDPNHESLMVELLQRKTQVEVKQIADGDPVEPDCLHVIPPGYGLTLEGRHFKLERFEEPRGLRRPIDNFFHSLAETQGEKCACVVLSGTGADGTAGLRLGKDLGGVIAVQSPEEARYDGMPFSAISTNLIDFTLPADEIIPRLRAYFEGQGEPDLAPLETLESPEGSISRVFEILRDATGNDFSAYKPTMLLRRMKRRMQVSEHYDLKSYVAQLATNPQEQEALAEDFLINVTSFFRDWEKFEVMRTTVLTSLIEGAGSSDELRFWVPGCSSGQEAYSLAMMIDKTCEELGRRPFIQIFATDIDNEMLARARRGEYLISEFADVPKAYQDRYTIASDSKFEVIARIRDMVRFSYHNLIQDPPFSKIDLISCRNLLIYLGEHLQSELFPVLHFSLRPGAYLFLGNSESVSRQSDLFAIVDQNARIFRRLNTAKRVHLNLPLGRSPGTRSIRPAPQRMSQERDFPEFPGFGASNDEVYQEYAPPFVRVTKAGRVIGSSGDLGLYLLSRPGEERDLYALLRDGIRDATVSLLGDVAKSGNRQAIEDLEVRTSFGTAQTDIIAHPMRDDTVAIIFALQEQLKPTVKKYAVAPISPDKRVADLQEELSRTQLKLKGKVEEIETANEELKSSNEEMMSMNEELQSANEELTTANEELKNKIDELTLAKADLDNFLGAADLAMVVLDRSMRIRHVTEAATDVLPIQQSDKGRFLTEFNLTLAPDELAQKVRSVIETHTPIEETSPPDAQGRSFFTRITPYFFSENSIEGATITLTDISQEASLRHNLERETERLMLAMRIGRMGLAELDVESGLVAVDGTLARQFHLPKGGTMTMEELTANLVADDLQLIETSLAKAIENGEEYEVDFRIREPDGGTRWIRTRGTPYTHSDGRLKVVGPTLDITKGQQREVLIGEMSHRIKNLFAVIGAFVRVSRRQHSDPIAMADDLVGKISSLGRVYDLARKRASLRGVELKQLMESVVEPHRSTQTVEFEGPATQIGADFLNTFTLIIHELTTNAFKHGALSHPDGRLQVTWMTDESGLMTFSWLETVPGFTRPEPRSGFGERLLAASVDQLGGSFKTEYSEDGAQVQFSLNLSGASHS
ncbi:MAG: CheR family methyltransferase [Pseudomonadota bacterium]